jgi:MFS family permease
MVKCNWGFIKLSPKWMLAYFTCTNLFIYLDRGALSAVVGDLQKSSGLGISSSEAGLLGSIFMLGYITASPIYAHLAQYVHPLFLMTSGMLIWSCATFLAGISRAYWLLLIARALTGIGEASFVSLAPPYIMDISPPELKSIWLSIFALSISLGGSFGFIYGNITSSQLGGWYWPFIIESIAALPLIILGFFVYKDPVFMVRSSRAESKLLIDIEEESAKPMSDKLTFSEQIKQLLTNKIFVLLALGYAFATFSIGGFIFWV